MCDLEDSSFYDYGQKLFIISKDIYNDLKEMRASNNDDITKTLVDEI